jgi:hypothetical protein
MSVAGWTESLEGVGPNGGVGRQQSFSEQTSTNGLETSLGKSRDPGHTVVQLKETAFYIEGR